MAVVNLCPDVLGVGGGEGIGRTDSFAFVKLYILVLGNNNKAMGSTGFPPLPLSSK